jgi:hypothetical protein
MKIPLACAASWFAASAAPAAQPSIREPGPAALARVVAPGPAALELASLLPGVGPAAAEVADQRMEATLARQFLNTWTPRGWACDPDQAECRAIASAMAAEFSPKLAEWSRRRWRVFAAYFLQASLSEADMRQAIAYFRTPGGAQVAAVLGRIAAPRADSEADLAVYAKAWAAIPQPPRPDFEAFYERTRHLPRRPLPPAPPPPRPPGEGRPHSD